MSEIKTCSACGSEARVRQIKSYWRVECVACCIETIQSSSEESAIEHWNNQPRIDGLADAEALREKCRYWREAYFQLKGALMPVYDGSIEHLIECGITPEHIARSKAEIARGDFVTLREFAEQVKALSAAKDI